MKARLVEFLAKKFGIVRRKRRHAVLLDKTLVLVNTDNVEEADYDHAWILALGAEAKIIFDIGANIGKSALLLSYVRIPDELVLIDPNPAALSIAADNLILNDLSAKARFVNCFVSDTPDEKVKFYTVGAGAAGSMYKSHAKTASELDSFMVVRTRTLDEISGLYNLVPDLVKVDVEGAELKVLNGASATAAKRKTVFMVEVHATDEFPIAKNTDGILEWCRKQGYTAWYLKEAVPLLSSEAISKRGRFHLLLQPSEREFPASLRKLPERSTLREGLKAVSNPSEESR